jgi:hypothetical protein
VINNHRRQARPGDPLVGALRTVLLAAVEAPPSAAGGIDSIHARACAALYVLLMDHPVDQRDRCRSCRRPDTMLGWRRQRCRVYPGARVWLQQPATFLHSCLAHEFGLSGLPSAHRASSASADPGRPAPAPPHKFLRAGRPDPAHHDDAAMYSHSQNRD